MKIYHKKKFRWGTLFTGAGLGQVLCLGAELPQLIAKSRSNTTFVGDTPMSALEGAPVIMPYQILSGILFVFMLILAISFACFTKGMNGDIQKKEKFFPAVGMGLFVLFYGTNIIFGNVLWLISTFLVVGLRLIIQAIKPRKNQPENRHIITAPKAIWGIVLTLAAIGILTTITIIMAQASQAETSVIGGFGHKIIYDPVAHAKNVAAIISGISNGIVSCFLICAYLQNWIRESKWTCSLLLESWVFLMFEFLSDFNLELAYDLKSTFSNIYIVEFTMLLVGVFLIISQLSAKKKAVD